MNGKLSDLPENIKNDAAQAGIVASEKERAGSFFQIDHSIVCARSGQDGVEVLDTQTAMEHYAWLKEYSWKAVNPEKDEITKMVREAPLRGYFLRALPGVETIYPLQACLFIGQAGLTQKVHNIIIAEEGAHLHIITGCTVSSSVKSGMHIGISEFYVKKNASITFTMIHNWAEDIEVRPRSVTYVEQGGTFINNYICMKPVKLLQLYPTTYLNGERARANFNSILFGKKSSILDTGARIYLSAKDARAEVISRAIAQEQSTIYARGHIIGEVSGVKGHLECRGLVLSPQARIHAIPELEARSDNLEMSHEAAVGKIAEKEILYLMSRGLSEEEATSAIVRGFLKVDLGEIPEKLKKEIQKITEWEFKS